MVRLIEELEQTKEYQKREKVKNAQNGFHNGSTDPPYQDDFLDKVTDEVLAKDGILEIKKANQELKWFNIFYITVVNLGGLYSLWAVQHYTLRQFATFFFVYGYSQFSAFGITGGVHRYWTHKAYKATLPMRIFLMFCYTSACINPIYDWVRDHRIHHKYTETDADPHNSKRGFFFAHCGWLMMKKHPKVLEKGDEIDMSDIVSDPVVQFDMKYHSSMVIAWFIFPIVTPMYFWNESLFYSIVLGFFFRYSYLLNAVWSVNSAAHIWGMRPYDKSIAPSENPFVSFLSFGEGWHNYHHVFPWDYKCSESPYFINGTTILLDFFAKIGWTYDLKQPSKSLVKTVMANKGDGSYGNVVEVKYPKSKDKPLR